MSKMTDGRERGRKLAEQIYAEREAGELPRRPHSLRPSEIGHECSRYLFLRYRWCDELEAFSGRMLRLFERGQREEDVFVKELKSVNAVVHDRDPKNPGKQISFSTLSGHCNGFLDTIAGNLMYSTADWVVVEYKTHGSKSYKQLEKEGVQQSKPNHYAQIQLYLHEMKLQEGLYVAVNKDTDELYMEFVDYDREFATRIKERGHEIIFSPIMPPRMNNNPSFFKCKMCSARAVCHEGAQPSKSCRTCEHSRPSTEEDRKICGMEGRQNIWICEHHGKPLTTDDQYRGCSDFEYSRSLIEELAT